jgi:hypothetical protein
MRRILDDAFGHHRRAVATIGREVGAVRAEPIAEDRVVPAYRSMQEMRIRVDQQLLRIEAMAAVGVISAVNPISVELPRT